VQRNAVTVAVVSSSVDDEDDDDDAIVIGSSLPTVLPPVTVSKCGKTSVYICVICDQ